MNWSSASELVWVRHLTGAGRPHSDLVDQVEMMYRELQSPLRNYLLRTRAATAEQAEDLIQEVFVELLRELLNGKEVRHPRAWAFKVAHHKAMDLRSLEGREASAVGQIGREENLAPDVENDYLRNERDQRLIAALALLTPSERQCIELRAEGLRYREIAESLGLQLSTVSTFVFRAVKKIARQLHD